jgi:transposase
MPKPYSEDLRERVVRAVEMGASRRAAAARFNIGAASAVRWMQRVAQIGSALARASGGSTSPLERHAEFLLGLIKEQPDLTLDEVVEALRAANLAGSRSAVARFYARHQISFKKKPARGRARAPRRGRGAPALEARAGAA